MSTIQPRWIILGPALFLGAGLFTASAAFGQDQTTTATATQTNVANPEAVHCANCGVELVGAPGAFDAAGKPVCAACAVVATPEPSAPAAPEPYDIWTTKQLTGDWGGARTAMKDAGFNFTMTLGTMSQANFRGGLNTHNAHETAGKAFYNFELDFGKMGLLDGATFFARGIQTWNSGIRSEVGSLSTPFFSTGSSGDRSLELDKWWYRQRLFDDRLEFRLGKLAAVSDLFDANDFAGNYMTTFMNSVLYANPAIPNTKGIGAYVKVWPVDWLYLSGMVVDPDTDNDLHRHGTGGFDTAFHDEDRPWTYWEAGYVPEIIGDKGKMPGHYRLGAWVDHKPKTIFRDTLGGALATKQRSGDTGVYMNIDQLVWKENDDPKDKQGLGLFARYGFGHGDVNRINHFWSVGAVYEGLVPERNKDLLGFGVAQSILSTQYRDHVSPRADRETVYELYYAINVTPWLSITPDVQVITNPGASKDARDALVGGLRVKVEF